MSSSTGFRKNTLAIKAERYYSKASCVYGMKQAAIICASAFIILIIPPMKYIVLNSFHF